MSNAESIWMLQRNHTVLLEENIGVSIPNKKAGPALLQKPSIRRAVALDSLPSRQACAISWAPTGYPAKKPSNSKDSVPAGILHSFPIGRRNEMFCPNRQLLIIPDKIKKGYREGITVRIHSSTPILAELTAVFPSRIMTNIQMAVIKPVSNDFIFI